MKDRFFEILLISILCLASLVIVTCSFFLNLSKETTQKIWFLIVSLAGVYVAVIGIDYYEDYLNR